MIKCVNLSLGEYMGFFSFIAEVGDIWAKAGALRILKDVLDKNGRYYDVVGNTISSFERTNRDFISETATYILTSVRQKYTDIYSGKFEQKPHDMATAFVGLVLASKQAEEGKSYLYDWIVRCTQSIGEELIKNRNLYPFTNMDIQIISEQMPYFESLRDCKYDVIQSGDGDDGTEVVFHPPENQWKY